MAFLDTTEPTRGPTVIYEAQGSPRPESEPPFSPTDYIQLGCQGRYDVEIHVEFGEETGSVLVRGGRLWHAAAGSDHGLTALRRLAFGQHTHVHCSAANAPEKPRNLPNAPWEEIMLDLARAHDENTRHEDSVDSILAEPSGDEGTTSFEQLRDDGMAAVLEKNYVAALEALERASTLRPNDATVCANVTRLRELLAR